MTTFLIALASAGAVLLAAAILFRVEIRRPSRSLESGEALGQGRWARYLANIEADLAESGVPMTAGRFLAYSVAVGGFVFAAVSAVAGMPLIGLVAGYVMATWWARGRWVGGPAKRMRKATTDYTAKAAREIANSISSGSTSEAALRSYVAEARSRADVPPNRVAERLERALAASRNMRADEAFRAEAAGLGNRAFSAMTEAFLTTSRFGDSQCELAMRQIANEVETELRLREERRTQLSLSLGSVKTMGYVITFIVVISNVLLPSAGGFYSSAFGQVALLAGAGWWYTGFRRISGEADISED